MALLLWDASGLAKRYTDEAGRDTVNAFFADAPAEGMYVTAWGYIESYAILLRKHNGGILSPSGFNKAADALQNEVIHSGTFALISISHAMIFGSLSLMQAHNLNSADAAILAAFLRFQRALPQGSPSWTLIASDKRLGRAAEAEGLRALNPEQVAAGDVAALLASQ